MWDCHWAFMCFWECFCVSVFDSCLYFSLQPLFPHPVPPPILHLLSRHCISVWLQLPPTLSFPRYCSVSISVLHLFLPLIFDCFHLCLRSTVFVSSSYSLFLLITLSFSACYRSHSLVDLPSPTPQNFSPRGQQCYMNMLEAENKQVLR